MNKTTKTTRRKAVRIDDAIGTEISYVDHPANSMSTIEQIVQKANAAADLEEARSIIRKSPAPSHDETLDLAEDHIARELDRMIEARRGSASEMPMAQRQSEAIHLARTLARKMNLDSDELVRRAFAYALTTAGTQNKVPKKDEAKMIKTTVDETRDPAREALSAGLRKAYSSPRKIGRPAPMERTPDWTDEVRKIDSKDPHALRKALRLTLQHPVRIGSFGKA
jgi:hypothetical protein